MTTAVIEQPEAVFSCDVGEPTLWTHGHVDKRKFKGWCLSNYGRVEGVAESLDAWGSDYDCRRSLAAGKVRHGWVIAYAGDLSGCGWDVTTCFRSEEPTVVDGRWDDVTDDYGRPVSVEIVDGPHMATWLEIA